MRNLRQLSLAAVALMILMAPYGQAQDTIQNPRDSTPTILYFHIFDTVNRFVINTQPMDSEFFQVGGANFPTTPDLQVPLPGTGLPLEEGWDMNTIYGYSTAGPVEYEFIENGRPRFHPERGIAATVDIDDSVDPIVYMYLDPRDVIGTSGGPTMSPELVLRITMQEGDNPGLDANLDEGKDIMVGETKFHMVDFDAQANPGVACDAACCSDADAEQYIDCQIINLGLKPTQDLPKNDVPANEPIAQAEFVDPNGNPVFVTDEAGFVEVPVVMKILQPTIPKKEAYNVRIDWFQSDGQAIPEESFATGWLRLASDPEHLNRMEFNIFNPIYFSFIHPQVAGGSLLIHAGGNSPWGTYDVDIDEVTIEMIHDATGKKIPDDQLKKLINTNEHVHGLHDEDTQLTYLWDFREHNAPLGDYTIKMSISNDAKDDDGTYAASAIARAQAKFIVTETEAIGISSSGEVVEPSLQEDTVDTPATGLVPAIALLAAGLLVARRRWNE